MGALGQGTFILSSIYEKYFLNLAYYTIMQARESEIRSISYGL